MLYDIHLMHESSLGELCLGSFAQEGIDLELMIQAPVVGLDLQSGIFGLRYLAWGLWLGGPGF